MYSVGLSGSLPLPTSSAMIPKNATIVRHYSTGAVADESAKRVLPALYTAGYKVPKFSHGADVAYDDGRGKMELYVTWYEGPGATRSLPELLRIVSENEVKSFSAPSAVQRLEEPRDISKWFIIGGAGVLLVGVGCLIIGSLVRKRRAAA